MSTNCYTAGAPFAAHGIIYCQDRDIWLDDENDRAKLVAPETYFAKEFNWQTDEDDVSVLVVRDWKYVTDDQKYARSWKPKNVYPDLWIKDGMEVYVVNESQYANGGEFSLAAFAKKKEYLEAFLKDMESLPIKNYGIEEDDAVVQFL